MATFAGSAHGTVFSTDFQSGYTLGDMQGQGGWVCSDPTPDASYIVNAGGGVFGSRSATLGFVSPLANDNVYLSHSVSTPLIGGGVDASFGVTYNLQDSDSGYGPGAANRDTFGFRLENGSGANLFSFFLTPTTQVPDPENSTEYCALSWSTGAGAPTVVLAPLKSAEGNNYTFTVSFYDAGGGVVGFNASVGAGNVNNDFSGVLGAGTTTESVANLGAFWNTYAGKTAPGSNLLIFDNVSLVPEPSSALLGLLGASFVFVRRRRA